MTASSAVGPGGFGVYTGRATNWPAVAVSAAMLVPLAAFSNGTGDRWGLAGLVIAFVGVAACAVTGTSVRTAAGPNGVTIHFGALGWPRLTYPLADIVHAEVIDLNPVFVAYGFWWTPHRTCCTVRSGPTLRLVLRNGRLHPDLTNSLHPSSSTPSGGICSHAWRVSGCVAGNVA